MLWLKKNERNRLRKMQGAKSKSKSAVQRMNRPADIERKSKTICMVLHTEHRIFLRKKTIRTQTMMQTEKKTVPDTMTNKTCFPELLQTMEPNAVFETRE